MAALEFWRRNNLTRLYLEVSHNAFVWLYKGIGMCVLDVKYIDRSHLNLLH